MKIFNLIINVDNIITLFEFYRVLILLLCNSILNRWSNALALKNKLSKDNIFNEYELSTII